MTQLQDHIPGEIKEIKSVDTKQGIVRHTVLFTDDSTGEDTTGLWEETEAEYTTGYDYTEKTNEFILFERVR
jgi:hypothetical protein